MNDRSSIDDNLFRKAVASISDAKNYSDLVHSLLLAAATLPRSREVPDGVSPSLFDFVREIESAHLKIMVPLLNQLHETQVARFKEASSGKWDEESMFRIIGDDAERADDERIVLSSGAFEALVVELMSASSPTLVGAVIGALTEFMAKRGNDDRSQFDPIVGRLADAIVASAYARAKLFTRHNHFNESLAGGLSSDGLSLDMPAVIGHLMTTTWASTGRDQGRIYAWASDRGHERIAIDS